MTDTGIIRKLDALGRIVFPKELRDTSAGKPAQNADLQLRAESHYHEKNY